MADGVPCPSPVSASEPYRCTCSCTTRESRERSRSDCTKRAAARMGPIVCELEGPMPMEKTSKKLVYMSSADDAKLFAGLGECGDSAIELLFRVGGGELGTDTRLLLGNHRVEEAHGIHAEFE